MAPAAPIAKAIQARIDFWVAAMDLSWDDVPLTKAGVKSKAACGGAHKMKKLTTTVKSPCLGLGNVAVKAKLPVLDEIGKRAIKAMSPC